MNTRERILKILLGRKSSITTPQLTNKINNVSKKTVRNVLGNLIKDGVVIHDGNYKYLSGGTDRYVTGYRTAL